MKLIYLRPQKAPEFKDFVWIPVVALLSAPLYYLLNPNLEFVDLFTTGKGFLALLFVVLVGVYLWRQAYRKQAGLVAGPVEIDHQTITLSKSSIGKVEFRRDEIVAVVEDGRGLAIQVKDGSSVLHLGPEVYTGEANCAAIRDALTAWAPEEYLEQLSGTEMRHVEQGAAVSILPLLIGIVATLPFNTIWVIAPVGLLVMGYLFFMIWKVWERLDTKAKRGYINTLVLFSAYFLLRLFQVLS